MIVCRQGKLIGVHNFAPSNRTVWLRDVSSTLGIELDTIRYRHKWPPRDVFAVVIVVCCCFCFLWVFFLRNLGVVQRLNQGPCYNAEVQYTITEFKDLC